MRLNDEPVVPKDYNVDPARVDHAFVQVGKRHAAQLV